MKRNIGLITPLLAYPTMVGGSAPATPWYLAGGVSAENCIAAYQPIGAASLAASYVNLANPGTYNATETVSSPGWNSTDGWINDNSSDKILDTGIIIEADWSFIYRVSDITTAAKTYFGGFYTATFYHYFQPELSFSTPRWVLYHGNQSVTVYENVTSGVFASSDRKVFYNGTLKATLASDGSSGDPLSYYLLGRNFTSGAYNGKMQAVAIYNTALTNDQVAAISTAMNAL